MKVILQQDVKGQGKKGQLVNVSDGYARNYLLPRKLAVEANTDNLNIMETQEKARLHKIDQEKAAARVDADKLSSVVVKVYAKAGSSGKLFGSITAKEICDSLKSGHGIELDKHKIVLEEPIRIPGPVTLKVKLYPEISADLNVVVIAEN